MSEPDFSATASPPATITETASNAFPSGWYPLPGSSSTVRYWDGANWSGSELRSNRTGTAPQDRLGALGLVTYAIGGLFAVLMVWYLGGNGASSAVSVLVGILSGIAALAAPVLAVTGLVRGRRRRHSAPFSLAGVMIFGVGSALALAVVCIGILFLTGILTVHL